MKQIIIGFALILFIAVAALATKNIMNGEGIATSYNRVQGSGGGDAQIINVHMEQGYKYVLEPSILEVGRPVKLVFDMSTVQGCMRSVVIPAFGAKKYLSNSDNTLTFTPTQAGEFKITCSMNMGRGSFTVTGSGVPSAGVPSVKIDDLSNELQGGVSCGEEGCGCGGFEE